MYIVQINCTANQLKGILLMWRVTGINAKVIKGEEDPLPPALNSVTLSKERD